MPNNVSELSIVELILAIARLLVDKPEDVSLVEVAGETGTLLRLAIDPTDIKKIIGEQGRIARSIRTLLMAISVKCKHRYSLEIVEHVHPSTMDRR